MKIPLEWLNERIQTNPKDLNEQPNEVTFGRTELDGKKEFTNIPEQFSRRTERTIERKTERTNHTDDFDLNRLV